MGQNSYDAVVSHLVFMVMSRPRRVLENAHAALRAPGILAFVTEDLSTKDSILTLGRSMLTSLRETLPAFAPVIPQREPIERDDVLLALLDDIGLPHHAIERFELRASLSRDQVWTFLGQTYAFGLLEAPLRYELRASLDAMLGEISESGAATSMTLPLRLVVARA
jgi:SAM-dependent methyltransferase